MSESIRLQIPVGGLRMLVLSDALRTTLRLGPSPSRKQESAGQRHGLTNVGSRPSPPDKTRHAGDV